ncbi:hypothetical protein Y032_0247g70 [Ancylostoma ceylanicum]|nr:hypothetical protein Y032_0247g70 [Ancylostoma ceylanicum]
MNTMKRQRSPSGSHSPCRHCGCSTSNKRQRYSPPRVKTEPEEYRANDGHSVDSPMPTYQPSYASGSFEDVAEELLNGRDLSLAKFGQILAGCDSRGEEYLDFISERAKQVRLDVNETKRIQAVVARLPQSSDTIVNRLVDVVAQQADIIVGMSSVVDSILASLDALRSNQERTVCRSPKVDDTNLPQDTYLHGKNLTRQWDVPNIPPFKAFNLNSLLNGWRRPGRTRSDDHVSQCVDFFRNYLVQATSPVAAVQQFSCRISGKSAKDQNLQDIPEPIVDVLVGCCLDGLLLGAPELMMTEKELLSNPTEYWIELGRNDKSRGAALSQLKALRNTWATRLRQALGRAMTDVRKYQIKEEHLVPRPKTKVAGAPLFYHSNTVKYEDL